jgi:hypothetical protein
VPGHDFRYLERRLCSALLAGSLVLSKDGSERPPRPPAEFLADGPSRVQEGASPDTDSPVEIGRQLDFYRQLLNFEREVLEQMRRLSASRPAALKEAVERSNIEPMQELIEQFEQRLSFWQERERTLNSK